MQSYEGRDYSKLLGMLLTSHNAFSFRKVLVRLTKVFTDLT